MNTIPKETDAEWHARMAALAANLTQDQVDAVQWMLGLPVGGTNGSWSPDAIAAEHTTWSTFKP
jgi:hypothetical protein